MFKNIFIKEKEKLKVNQDYFILNNDYVFRKIRKVEWEIGFVFSKKTSLGSKDLESRFSLYSPIHEIVDAYNR